MRIRTQLVVVTLIAVGWASGNINFVEPVLAESPRVERMSLAELESAVARNPQDTVATRALCARYLSAKMYSLVVETVSRTDEKVKRDAQVCLLLSRAHESLGNLQTASALVNGAANRCAVLPTELAPGEGCDVRTQTELALESAALERMIHWGITPITDPERADLAHQLSGRPIRMSSMQ